MKTDYANGKFFSIYQKIVLIATLLYILLFMFFFILSNLPDSCQAQWVEELKCSTESLSSIISSIICALLGCHIVIIIIKSFITKNSFFGLIKREWLPFFLPIVSISFIKLLSGQFNDKIPDVLVGICSGLISSLIVIVLDRNHELAETVLKYATPELMQNNKDEGDSKQGF